MTSTSEAPYLGDDARRVLTPEDDPAPDAPFYAAEHGMSLDEAVRRLMAERAYGPLVPQIREAAAGRYVGSALTHEPDFFATVVFTGGEEGLEEARRILASAPLPVVIRTDAQHSLAELLEIRRAIITELDDGTIGSDVNEVEGTVELDISPKSRHAAKIDDLAASFESRFDVKMIVHRSSGTSRSSEYVSWE